MKLFSHKLFFLLAGILLATSSYGADSNSLSPYQRPEIQSYLQQTSKDNHLNYQQLINIFNHKIVNQKVIDLMNRPAEKKTWQQYKELFITKKRVRYGVDFYHKHNKIIKQIEKKYHVPGNILVAIIGIETNYGSNTGSFNTLETLATLAFNYPKRASFFQNELTELLIMAKEDSQLNLNHLEGSYAGALGMPQFMPSNYRRYAVAFNPGKKINLFTSSADALASAANYLNQVGKWQAKQPLLIKLSLSTKQQKSLDDIMANKNVKYTDLQQLKIKIPSTITQDMRIRIVRLEKSENEFEYLLGYNNYLSIFSYNPRDNYAMAVATLAESIQNQLT